MYMLRSAAGQKLACVNGFLYGLEGKLLPSGGFRWKCMRSYDVGCTSRIQSELMLNGNHRLQGVQPQQLHLHAPFTPHKLSKICQRHNIRLLNKSAETKFKKTLQEDCDSEELLELLALPDQITELDPDGLIVEEQEITKPNDGVDNKLKNLSRAKAHIVVSAYELVHNPLEMIHGKHGLATDGKHKFTFLPSAKGNKVLVLDNHTYHFDSRSPRNGHCYWTCIMRRHKDYKCNGRVTTDAAADDGTPSIVKVSGTHMHSDNSSDIQRRLSIWAQRTKKPMPEFCAKDASDIIEQCSLSSLSDIEYACDDDDVDDFCDVEDEITTCKLPTKIEEMKQSILIRPANQANKHVNNDEEEEQQEEDAEIEIMNIEIETGVHNNFVDELPMKEEFLEEFEEMLQNESDALALPIDMVDKFEDDVDLARNMDINKVSMLCSAKGGQLLCIDGYIYHAKSTQNKRTYWTCIKRKAHGILCKSRVATKPTITGISVIKVTNRHNHPISEVDIKQRLYNEAKCCIAGRAKRPQETQNINAEDW